MTIALSERQRRAVMHDEGALLIEAGPGSGKTRVLTERIRRLLSQQDPNIRILALTFTNKAANEMKERLVEFPAIEQRTFIGTLHSFCIEVLANRGKSVGIDGAPHILERYEDRREALLSAAMNDPELRDILLDIKPGKERNSLTEGWLNIIREHKMNLRLPEVIDEPLERKLYESYDDVLRASKVLDYDDLLLLTYRLFEERPKIADFYRRQYSYICIDEGQDLNEAQYGVIRALCGPEYRNVMVVGDPKQAIFVWNGASPKYLDRFATDFGAAKIELVENFRSSRAVIGACQALKPYGLQEQFPIEGEVSLAVGKDEAEEATLIVDRLVDLLRRGHKDIEGAVTPVRCAFIGRTRYVLQNVESELRSRQIPYYKNLSTQAEDDSQIVGDFKLALRLLANPDDRLHLSLLQKRWKSKATSDSGTDVTEPIELLQQSASTQEQNIVVEAVKLVHSSTPFQMLPALDFIDKSVENLSDARERGFTMEDTNAWRKQWDLYLRTRRGGEHNLITFLTQVALGATQAPTQDGVALLTVHSSKGLEFDVVFLVGMAEGTFPDYRAKGPSLEEERRNAFVACSRARRVLICSYARTKKMPWGDIWNQKPSPYLYTIGLLA
jgi:DNA helicase-2/ATP-dependent DNA helicase PcrA